MHYNSDTYAEIYTDGSCHTQLLTGAWVAIILSGGEKKILSGTAPVTSHQKMELLAVTEALEFVHLQLPAVTQVRIFTDSQYVAGLPERKHRLVSKGFINKDGREIPNVQQVNLLYKLLTLFDAAFVKLKAHQSSGDSGGLNREADILSRKLVREMAGLLSKGKKDH
jgi:ribonuclease HI